ncbi:MAG: PQQ-dependent sugar dehydrogenase [Xanthobacteraceae bacterium]|nr:PQQ-dependent sugar dehydrogenase [Xanthobacteraceae bacterium]
MRVALEGDRFAGEERIPLNARVRDVLQGPDGAVYAATDEANGRILRLTPAARGAAREGAPGRTEGAAAD